MKKITKSIFIIIYALGICASAYSQTTTQPSAGLSHIIVTDVPDSQCQHWCKDHCVIPTVHLAEPDVVIGPYPIYIHNHSNSLDCKPDSTKYAGSGSRSDDAYTNGVLRINNSMGSNLFVDPHLITFDHCKNYDITGYATHNTSSPAPGTKSDEQLECSYDMTFKRAVPAVPGATVCYDCGEYVNKVGKVIIKFEVFSVDVNIVNGVSQYQGKNCVDVYDWGVAKIDTNIRKVTGVTAVGYPDGGTYSWEAKPILNNVGRARAPNAQGIDDYVYIPGENTITITNPTSATVDAKFDLKTNQIGMYLICTYTMGGICCKTRVCINLEAPDPAVQGTYKLKTNDVNDVDR